MQLTHIIITIVYPQSSEVKHMVLEATMYQIIPKIPGSEQKQTKNNNNSKQINSGN